MNPEVCQPFVGSLENVLKTMLQLNVTASTPREVTGDHAPQDVSGIISFSGDLVGSFVLGFPMATARRIVGVFVGSELDPTGADFADAIGELANMVAGNAKAKFSGRKISISCPSVIVGSGHSVHGGREFGRAMVTCECECGEFVIEVSARQDCAVLAGPVAKAA